MCVPRGKSLAHILRSIGNYVTPIGLLALLTGLIISFVRPEWVVAMLLLVTSGLMCLVVGFLAKIAVWLLRLLRK